MTPFHVPSTQSNREILTLGIIISTMVYGGVATLVLTYISLLLKTSHAASRRLRNFLLAYVVFMVAVSTVNTVTLIIAFTIGRNILPFGNSGTGNGINLLTFPNGMAGALCVTFASWGADGFMLWRCAVLYEGISRPRRLAILTVIILLAMASFGFCTYLLINANSGLLSVITVITTAINLFTAILITARILFFQRYMRRVGSGRNFQYTTIIIICVESSALIVVFSILYIVLLGQGNPISFIFMASLVHVNVISPLLIVYRVALGKAGTSPPRRSEDGPVVSALHFASIRNNGLNSAPDSEQRLQSVCTNEVCAV